MSAVVMELKKELAALNARLSNDEVGAFRSCLCAIAARLQSEEAAATLSLAEWWQWLDDEGYERERFAAALRHICQSSLSEPAWTELQSDVHCMQARPEGLPELCQHVQERFKTLASTMERLEACAQAEQHALEAIAAGKITKKDILIGAGVYAGYNILVGGPIALMLYRRQKMEPVRQLLAQSVEEKVAAADKLLEVAKHDEVEAMRTVTENLRMQLREVEILGPDTMLHKTENEYKKYSAEINDGFKRLAFPDGVRPLPIFNIAKEGEQYIVHKGGRDMVKFLIDGEIYHFYRSSGAAQKDPDEWPVKAWFPVNGIGPDGWINKTMVSAKLGSQSDKIRKIQDLLLLEHEESIFKREQVGEKMYLDWENEQLFIESVNKGLKNVVANDGSNFTNKELLRKAFYQIIKDRNPKAYYVLKKERKLDGFIKKNICDPAEKARLNTHWLINNPDITPDDLAKSIRTEEVKKSIKDASKKIEKSKNEAINQMLLKDPSLANRLDFRPRMEERAAAKLLDLKIQAETLGLANIRSDSERILSTKKIMNDATSKLQEVEEDWAGRIIKVQGSKLQHSLNMFAEKKLSKTLDQATSQAEKKLGKTFDQAASQVETNVIEVVDETKGMILEEAKVMETTVADDMLNFVGGAERGIGNL